MKAELTFERCLLLIILGVCLGGLFMGFEAIDSYKSDPDHWHRVYIEKQGK